MGKIDRQVEYWNRAAREKDFSHPVDFRTFKSLVSADQPILDYGCGYGRTCSQLLSHGFQRVVGVDPSSKMIERGRKENPHLDLRVLKGGRLPFEQGSFQAVILFSVLTCIPSDEGQKRILDEASRVLAPGALVLYRSFRSDHSGRD